MKKIYYVLFFLFFSKAFSQQKDNQPINYPTSYFQSPLGIPLILSGTFGELRPNHFHAGLDIKTKQRDGLEVFAAAEGYVARIRVSEYGYGKAIYIVHPNGYTTVYAHLQKFNDIIEKFIKDEQYKKESYEVQVFPKMHEIKVKKGELIAFSGSTGGYVGPHLHFEIRDTKTEFPINPLLFGYEIEDSKLPQIATIIGYSLSPNAHINKLNIPNQLHFKKLESGNLLADTITAFGDISFGIQTYDQLDGASNYNGIYKLTMEVNGSKFYEFIANSFSYDETKYLNLLIDYEYYKTRKKTVHTCFVDPNYPISLNSFAANNGKITIEEGKSYNVKITVEDFKGNSKNIRIPIIGKKENEIVKNTPIPSSLPVNHQEFSKYDFNGASVAFPKNTFYKDAFLDINFENGILKIHEDIIPLTKNYTLTFDVSAYTENEKKQMYIASIDNKGRYSYEKTYKKDNSFYTSTKNLGTFTLAKDSIAPSIKLHNFRDEQWISNHEFLKIKILDKQAGIDSYRGEIDGKWILLEYDLKNNMLTYDFKDSSYSFAKHSFKLVVTDKVGNTSEVLATFYRKF